MKSFQLSAREMKEKNAEELHRKSLLGLESDKKGNVGVRISISDLLVRPGCIEYLQFKNSWRFPLILSIRYTSTLMLLLANLTNTK